MVHERMRGVRRGYFAAWREAITALVRASASGVVTGGRRQMMEV